MGTLLFAWTFMIAAIEPYVPPTMFSPQWFQELYEYNVDSFLAVGWLILGILTVASCVEMLQKIFKPYAKYNP